MFIKFKHKILWDCSIFYRSSMANDYFVKTYLLLLDGVPSYEHLFVWFCFPHSYADVMLQWTQECSQLFQTRTWCCMTQSIKKFMIIQQAFLYNHIMSLINVHIKIREQLLIITLNIIRLVYLVVVVELLERVDVSIVSPMSTDEML